MKHRCSQKTASGKVCKNNSCNSLSVCCVHARECSVCLERTSRGPVRTLMCGHVFHEGCIAPWFEKDHRCPYCRACVHKPLLELTMNPEIDDSTETLERIRQVVRDMYAAGNLPDGPMYVDLTDEYLVIIDLLHDEHLAYLEYLT